MTTGVSAAEDDGLSERERIGMSDRQLRGLAADLRETLRGAAVQPELRRTAGLPDYLDVSPQHPLRMAGAERFHRGFFRGEPAGEMNRRMAAAHAIRDFAFRENAMRESLAVALDGGGDPWNLRGVESESDDGHASKA
jgi:hypothetical protein